jgi:hypothetical protein
MVLREFDTPLMMQRFGEKGILLRERSLNQKFDGNGSIHEN